ncbi:MAG: NADP-specific glutamate dehydrogenase [Myxococcales bacterium]|nr:NADP-specific glutamate dehydrogenase [Myxococcales bacterium]
MDHVEVDEYLKPLLEPHRDQPEYCQSVREVAHDVVPWLVEQPALCQARILERIIEPERAVSFRVVWEQDDGEVSIARGYRIQFNSALGPYKGGLRFHSSVNPSVLKFLGFEQIFKNALTGLPLGAGKGGADFDPKGRSDREVMRFCQAFMSELFRHIGPETDVPAGDIGVASREIGYLFGQYKRLRNEWHGVLTGKGLDFGGSALRTEATGYGCIYFTAAALEERGDKIAGKTCVVSGAGNVAQHVVEKLIDLDGHVVTMSDSTGFVHDPDGFDEKKLTFVKELKNERRGSLDEYAEAFDCSYQEGESPWSIPADLAFPCATQNEIAIDDAETLIDNGLIGLFEGANMPCTADALRLFRERQILVAPGKAANAGGVAVSGLEMSQNAQHLSWSRADVDDKLRKIMSDIHRRCAEHGRSPENGDVVDYVCGANLSAFRQVAAAMLQLGLV